MLTDTLKWREDFKITEVVKEEFPQDIFGSLGRVRGKDKEGHPIVYVTWLRPLLVPPFRMHSWESIRRHADVGPRRPGITSTGETRT